VNLPWPAGRSTRSHTFPLELPAFTRNLVTVPLNGTRSLGCEIGRYVHLIPATQMFVLGVPAVLPSVTWCVAALAAIATLAMANAPQTTPTIAAKGVRILITCPLEVVPFSVSLPVPASTITT
jgi:hypothetical protein